MRKLVLSELFENCAFKVNYIQVRDSVKYAFVEEGDTRTIIIK